MHTSNCDNLNSIIGGSIMKKALSLMVALLILTMSASFSFAGESSEVQKDFDTEFETEYRLLVDPPVCM